MRTGPLLVFALALAACAGGGPRFAPGGEATDDGLRSLAGTRFDRAWARPGLDVSRYERIWLVSEGIVYEKPPERARGSERDDALEPMEREALESELLAALRTALFGDGVWKLAEIPGPEVLLLRVALIDVVVEVPPEPMSSRSQVYIASAGHAVLVLELVDSVSGQALVRVGDRGEFEPTLGMMRSTSITNRIEVRRTFEAWARLARRGLDELHMLSLPESPE